MKKSVFTVSLKRILTRHQNGSILIYNDRGVEQLVARRAHNPKVAGSSPAPATNMKMPGLSGRFHLFAVR
jgi:hypothetical protein